MSGQRPEDWSQRRIILLRRSNGSRVHERDLPGYRGDGPEATLALVLDRLGAQMQAAWDRAVDLEAYEELQARGARLSKVYRELYGSERVS